MSVVAEASNGLEAIEQYRIHRPHITLMDLQMPDMSGIDAISAIRAGFPAARIIVLTTFAGDVLAQRALKAGALAYVLKGLVRKELLGHDSRRAKAYLWHGSPHRALGTIDERTWDIGTESPHALTLQEKLDEFMNYITTNV